MLTPCLHSSHFLQKCVLSSVCDRRLSLTLLRYRDNRRSGGEPLLENEPGSSSDPPLPSPCRADNTLMSRQVRHFSEWLQNFYICSLFNALWVCQKWFVILGPLFSELYLEELSDVIVATDIECQTDAFLDKPATPLFIPAKSGKDVETQIEEGEVGDPSGTSGHTLYIS